MEKILIPTDFSKCADVAIDFAMQSARISAVELSLIHVMEVYPTVYDPSGLAATYPMEYREDMEKQLLELKDQIWKTRRHRVDTGVYDGPVTGGIIVAQKDKHADIIVMGTNGASGLRETFLGSQTGAIIGQAKIPVLALPCNYKWKKPQKVLLATNNFEQEPAVLEFILDFVRFYEAELHIVVFTNDKKDKALTFVEHHHQLNSYIEMIKLRYGIDSIANQIHGIDLEESLNEYIKEHQIDVLAMVTHKRKFFAGIFQPSTTKRMSYHTTVPLLAIPSKAGY